MHNGELKFIEFWNLSDVVLINKGNYTLTFKGVFENMGEVKDCVVKDYSSRYYGNEIHFDKFKYEVFNQIMFEIKCLTSLSGHPNIVSLLDNMTSIDEKTKNYEVSLKFESLSTLDQYFGYGYRLIDLVNMMIDVANGIGEIHKNGYLHRDIKISNILVDSNGRYKICDFGCSSDREGYFSKLVGSPDYMSDEVKEKHIYSKKSDIYALLISGLKLLSESRSLKKMEEAIRDIELEFPSEVGKIFRKGLDEDSDSSYESSDEIISDLNNILIQVDQDDLLRYIFMDDRPLVEEDMEDNHLTLNTSCDDKTLKEDYLNSDDSSSICKKKGVVHIFNSDFSSGKSVIAFNSAVAIAMKNRKKKVALLNLGIAGGRKSYSFDDKGVKSLSVLIEEIKLDICTSGQVKTSEYLKEFSYDIENISIFDTTRSLMEADMEPLKKAIDMILVSYDFIIIDDLSEELSKWMSKNVSADPMYYIVTTPDLERLGYTGHMMKRVSESSCRYKVIVNSNPGFPMSELERFYIEDERDRYYHGSFSICNVYEDILKSKFCESALYGSNPHFTRDIENMLELGLINNGN